MLLRILLDVATDHETGTEVPAFRQWLVGELIERGGDLDAKACVVLRPDTRELVRALEERAINALVDEDARGHNARDATSNDGDGAHAAQNLDLLKEGLLRSV